MPISFKVLSGEMKINLKMAEDMKGETEISEYNPVSLARAYGVRKREYGFWEKIKNLFIKLRESYDQRLLAQIRLSPKIGCLNET